MFRTETTLVVGSGANREIEMPDGPELLNRIVAGYDFDRLGSEVQSRDLINLAQIFESIAPRYDTTTEELMNAGRKIRAAGTVTTSIESIMEQLSDDPLVTVAGKVGIIYYTLQAESKSTLAREPRNPGEMPLRGTENWLFKLGQMIVTGAPRREAENCFYKLSIIAFTYDRAIEHYLPWVAAMAFGMDIDEARALVDQHVRIVHPLGMAGQLPWQQDDKPVADWGQVEPDDYAELTRAVFTFGKRSSNRQFTGYMTAEMAQGKRLGMLGFDFDPLKLAMIFGSPMDHDPEVLVSFAGTVEEQRDAIARLIKRKTGISHDDLFTHHDGGSYELLRDNAPLLES
ncbi:hypothetical protein [Erythrobacter sp. YT30]|uniref:hypothetical protein n=1 Tax=Erythrobacter sp. YT30 TaxID=1735012 RepID=UPI00076D061A|nr:hypothetical protein [Erythrobacter sp. YT30]KWV92759.1 hypothetical protein AUC45_00910 [Erythrobacter sp. YT30]